jgi:UDP-MurNAc hydroxylase
MKTKIKFVNHASVEIKCGDTSFLCDPWYEGDAFNGGWNLLLENKPSEIENLLQKINYIWISHEHPDHFSIKFFKTYKNLILKNNIHILFQKTKDKRVINYLNSNGFITKEVPFNTKIQIAPLIDITLFKDGFYDSALLIRYGEEKVLNLNDCEINTIQKASDIYRYTGDVDVFLTQFSYAAWKGGIDNLKWRQNAAKDKISTIRMQSEIFKPKYVIPFASYVYFSNELNFYLNDSANTPRKVYDALNGSHTKIVVLKPLESLDESHTNYEENVVFWDKIYSNVNSLKKITYKKIELEEIQENYITYKNRIKRNNNIYLMLFVNKLRIFNAFNPVRILIEDLNVTVLLDIFADDLKVTTSKPDLKMPSASLQCLLKNSFGFDTLTVNGCFEETRKNGFTDSAKTLAIENLNNLGIRFSPQLFFNLSAIKTFVSRLSAVKRKMAYN